MSFAFFSHPCSVIAKHLGLLLNSSKSSSALLLSTLRGKFSVLRGNVWFTVTLLRLHALERFFYLCVKKCRTTGLSGMQYTWLQRGLSRITCYHGDRSIGHWTIPRTSFRRVPLYFPVLVRAILPLPGASLSLSLSLPQLEWVNVGVTCLVTPKVNGLVMSWISSCITIATIHMATIATHSEQLEPLVRAMAV